MIMVAVYELVAVIVKNWKIMFIKILIVNNNVKLCILFFV